MTQGRRYEGLPDIPSVVEALPGGEQPQGWYGFFGPPGLPRPILARLNGDIQKVLADKETRAKIDEASFTAVGGSPEQFAQQVKTTFDDYARAIRNAGIKPE